MNNTDNNSKKKKKTSPGLLIFFAVMILSSILEEMPRNARGVLIPLIGTVVIVVIILLITRGVNKKAASSAVPAARSAGRGVSPQPTQRYAPAPARAAAPQPVRHYERGPDAYCLVCDQTGVDHFERDRQRRLKQLDYWLSIGLIERKEYNLLRSKYSRDVPHQNIV